MELIFFLKLIYYEVNEIGILKLLIHLLIFFLSNSLVISDIVLLKRDLNLFFAKIPLIAL